LTEVDYISGKVLVITGAGSGFGRQLMIECSALGASVVGADISEEGLEETLRQTKKTGGAAVSCIADVTKLTDMQAVVAIAVAEFGRLDVLVNNAGIMPLAFYDDHAAAAVAWDRCIDINIKGVLHGIMAAYDQMIEQGRGHIVNLSSIYGNYPVVGAGVYGASKAAVDFLSASLRMEAQGKIKVTNVKPTGVPATNLGSGVVNNEAIVGILGHKAPAYLQMMQAHAADDLPAESTDVDNIEYYALDPQHLVEQIIHAVNQPWGVTISDITVRAAGDAYLL